MMKKQNFALLVLILLMASPIYSQALENSCGDIPALRENSALKRALVRSTNARVATTSYNNVSGTPYLNKSFAVSKINNYNSLVVANYDAYRDVVQINVGDSKSFYLEKKVGNKVTFKANNQVYQAFYDESEGKVRFFKVLKITDKFSLLQKQKVKIAGGEKPKTGYDNYVAPYFRKGKAEYYISLDNSYAVKVPLNKRKFSKLFADNSSTIGDYLKKSKSNLKQEKDLLRTLEYYASL